MLETLNSVLGKWEPIWLLVILAIEMVAGVYSAWILTVEYNYDREWNERRRERRKKKMEFEHLTTGEGK